MNSLASRFLRVAVIYALMGMALGIGMGVAYDFTLRGVHTHLNLLGWVSMAIAGLFYRTIPEAAEGLLPSVQFWLANLGMLGLVGAIALISSGYAWALPIAIVSSILVIAAMALFAVIVFRATGPERAA